MTLDRYAVERAVKASSLAPPSRLLMHTLLTHVTEGTLVVPDEHAPSLSDLVAETGLSRSAVADHLNNLERGGWLDRRRPTTKQALSERARTGYELRAPEQVLKEPQVGTSPSGGPVQETDRSGRRTSPGDGLVKEEPQVGTSPGAGPVRQADSSSSLSENYKKKNPSSSPPAKKTKKPVDLEPPREDVDQLCGRLLSWLTKKNYRKRPAVIPEEWRKEARLLLDKDEIALQEALDVLDWSQRDGFWTLNINSMSTFRKQYGQLEMKSRDARGAAGVPAKAPTSPAAALPPRDGYTADKSKIFGTRSRS